MRQPRHRSWTPTGSGGSPTAEAPRPQIQVQVEATENTESTQEQTPVPDLIVYQFSREAVEAGDLSDFLRRFDSAKVIRLARE